jgi:hypothetical protein
MRAPRFDRTRGAKKAQFSAKIFYLKRKLALRLHSLKKISD